MSAGTSGLRVSLLLPCFWPEVRRGGERMTWELAAGLHARGHRPRLVTSHPGPPRRDVEEGVPVTRHWRPPEGWLGRRGWLPYLSHVPFTYASLVTGRDDIVQAFHATDALAAARHTRRRGIPSVFAYLGLPDRGALLDRRGRLEATVRALRGCTVTTALSEAAAHHFERWLGVEARVIPPGVDLKRFTPGGERAERHTILCAADVGEPRKRVEVLLGAFRRVQRRRPGARLMLSRPSNRDVARRLEGGEGVELVDLDDPATLAEAYRRAWVTVLPSYGEAFGLVLVESLACGTPVVGSRHGGIPEIVDDRAVGLTFSVDDEEALAGALLDAFELTSDPATSTACRSRAEGFSVERCTDAYEELYRELL